MHLLESIRLSEYSPILENQESIVFIHIIALLLFSVN